ncbi:MAG: metal ABC transporter substrate-binding protein [Propionibacteriaceae bacterium]
MRIIARPTGVLLATAAFLLVSACGASTSGTSRAAGAEPGQLHVVAAFYPFQFVAERVAGSHGWISSLTQPGAEPHDVELTPRQVASVADADLVVYEKGFQAAVDKAVTDSDTTTAFDTTTVVPLQPFEEGRGQGADGQVGADQHAADPGSAEQSGLDPHVWLDPTNMITITRAVARQLSTADPDHAADYASNATVLESQLSALDAAFRSGLRTCQRREFITTHAAFGYLARDYGLTQIGINGVSPDAEPSPARIADIQTEARQYGVTTIFYETLVSPDIAKSIASDLHLRTDVLDPIEGITDRSRGQDYLAVMKANLAALQAANACR